MTSADFLIRKAERGDIPAVLELIDALADFEQLARPDTEALTRFARDGWPTDGQSQRFTAWLALARQSETETLIPAAYAITFETYSSFLARPTLYLEDIFVQPDFRRHALGTAMMQRLLQEAAERGCGRMDWVVLDWNTGAQAFYQNLGAKHLTEWQCYRVTTPIG